MSARIRPATSRRWLATSTATAPAISLWYNPTTGDVDIWKMSNGHWAGSTDVGPHPLGWQPLGAADFNLDGTNDIAWQNPATTEHRHLAVKNGQWSEASNVGLHPGPVVAVGVGDFDNNGVSDIMWRDTITGHIDNWLLAYSLLKRASG